MPNLLDEMMEAEEPEDETPVDEDILGMLEQALMHLPSTELQHAMS